MLLIGCRVVVRASPTTIYVPDDYATIQEAIENAKDGDTIFVRSGTYYENVFVVYKNGITLRGSGASVTIIDGKGEGNVVYAYLVTSFTIEGFTIRNSGHTGKNPGSTGIHIDPNVFQRGDFYIINNVVQDNCFGISLWNMRDGNTTVENNIISNNEVGIQNDGCRTMTIVSNTIVHNKRDGCYEWFGRGSYAFKNNIIVSNMFGIHSTNRSIRFISYNDVWNNSEGNYVESYPGYWDTTPFAPFPGTEEISADPLFIDIANCDYHLSIKSPCMDAGTNEDAPRIDIEGNPRPFDGDGDGTAVVDIGAYERSGTIYIRADGSINPPTAPISSGDNVTYTFTANVNDSIVVQRDNIVLDGAGYMVEGTGAYESKGIDLRGRSNVTIKNMEVKRFDYGVDLNFSSNNTLSGNTIANNQQGIWLEESSDYNTIYHNNLINNTIVVDSSGSTNVWDYGYPSGGNYWSDYAGVDSYSGLYQNQTGSDGIGDTPYATDANNQDNYPLMGMFSDFNVTYFTPPLVSHTCNVTVISNSTVSDFVAPIWIEHPEVIMLEFKVTGEQGTTGFCRVSFPTAMMNGTYHVSVNGTEVLYVLLPCSNADYSYLYFTYAHSTEGVIITPEFPSVLILPLFMVATLLAVIVYKRKHAT
jgi:parallel beta-helix repeat protein